MANLRGHCYRQLQDVSFFYNSFQEETLKGDVLPWLFAETELCLKELNMNEEMPSEMMDTFIRTTAQAHKDTLI